jgi:predicted nucleic acid-binding protein
VAPTVEILVDTNILLRSIEAGHPMHSTARESVRRLVASGKVLGVAAQNLIEFWVVATRPLSANGLGLNIAQANFELSNFRAAYHLLVDTAAIFMQWERLAVA